MNRKFGVLVLVLALGLLVTRPHTTSASNVSIWGAAHCENPGAVVLDAVGAVTGAGIEAAGIILAVNPWLAMGVGLCIVA